MTTIRAPVGDTSRPIGSAIAVPAAVALVLAAVYCLHTPLVGDLAAQTARGDLFTRSGEVPWWGSWYGGLATASYSLVTPALLSGLGPVLLGAASLVITPLAAVPLLQRATRPVAGGVALAATAAADVACGRTTFAVGLVVALLSLSAAVRDRPRWAAGLAMLAAITSPVAGILNLLVSSTVASVTRPRRPWLACALGSTGGIGALWWLSGGGGTGSQPIGATNLLLAVGGAAAVLLSPVGRVLRCVAGASIAAEVLLFLIPSPMGSNLTRIVLVGAAPAIIGNARLRPVALVLVSLAGAAPAFLNLGGEVLAAGGPDTSAQFVAGLRTQLAAEPQLRNHRLEVVDVATHWPSTRLVATVTLARGWERQADEALNPELYGDGPPLTAASYRAFLDRNAVAFVAIPRNVPLDLGTRRETVLLASGVPYLHLVWSDRSWRLYAVSKPVPVVAAPAQVVRLTDTGVIFVAPRPGRYATDLRWSPYLVAADATVTRDALGTAVVSVTQTGPQTLHAVWRLP